MKLKLNLFYALLILCGCSSNNLIEDKAPLELLEGSWYREQEISSNGMYQCVIHHSGNGEFIREHREIYPGISMRHQLEFGEWGVSNGFYICKTVGGQENGEEYSRDSEPLTLEIIDVTDSTFLYICAGEVNIMQKVDKDFTVPSKLSEPAH